MSLSTEFPEDKHAVWANHSACVYIKNFSHPAAPARSLCFNFTAAPGCSGSRSHFPDPAPVQSGTRCRHTAPPTAFLSLLLTVECGRMFSPCVGPGLLVLTFVEWFWQESHRGALCPRCLLSGGVGRASPVFPVSGDFLADPGKVAVSSL